MFCSMKNLPDDFFRMNLTFNTERYCRLHAEGERMTDVVADTGDGGL